MSDTPPPVILIGLADGTIPAEQLDDHFDELERLVDTAGGRVVARMSQERSSPDPACWMGRGKVEELSGAVATLGAKLIVAEGDLSPAQIRNLQEKTGVRVLDRTDLILDIFARHARSREARIAVELALLEQQLPRLAGQWYGLSRQGGGIGTRGLGEKRLELDRRLVRTRISRLKKDLERIETSRGVQRRGREGVSVVAIAGYTNAGKSTLFNALVAADVYAADQLFATLDARHGRLLLEAGMHAILVDTVGFIRRLPHKLVASFRSTLAEVADADLVLHVVDGSHPAADEQLEVASETLQELGVETAKILIVENKIDRLPAGIPGRFEGAVRVSAATGEGLATLREAIARQLLAARRMVDLEVDASDGRSLAEIGCETTFEAEETDEGRLRLRVRLSPALIGRLRARETVHFRVTE